MKKKKWTSIKWLFLYLEQESIGFARIIIINYVVLNQLVAARKVDRFRDFWT